jgi:PDZ domain-containing protein
MLLAGFLAVVLTGLVVVFPVFPVRYAVLNPGPVLNTLGSADGKPLIAISGHQTYKPTAGTLDLTTVSVLGNPGRGVSLLSMIGGWLSHSSAVVPQEQVFAPGTTQAQTDQQNKLEMVSSQESATAAALGTLGITVPTTLTVAGVAPSAPAAKVLQTADVIEAVDGHAVTDLASLRTLLVDTRAGGPVTVTVQRKGSDVTLHTATIADATDGHTELGVYLNPTFHFPFSVKIQIENIGGPSAGMMFALGIIDTLTPGDLTGGKRIAGTGTIDADGTVGPIGGIRQKLVGSHRAGARYFLAPADNCDEVRGHIPSGLQVFRTSTLTQSRTEVMDIASGNTASLPTCG